MVLITAPREAVLQLQLQPGAEGGLAPQPVVGIPLGGGKGGIICDPTRMSRRELEARADDPSALVREHVAWALAQFAVAPA